jgi:predicted kinase
VIWEAFESEKRKALREGRNVVLDACHMSRNARRHALQGPNARHRKVCVVFDVPLSAIRKRCVQARRLSGNEAERMWRAFQACKPTAPELRREGFEEVYLCVG